MTRSFTFTKIHVGWVTAEIRSTSEVHTVQASYVSDAIRDFADALASLGTTPTATCFWEQEPGVFEWDLLRSGSGLTVTGWSKPNQQPQFQFSFLYRSFCNDVLNSLNNLKSEFGLPKFEKEWGYPFPAEASKKLEDVISSNQTAETA